MMTEECWKCEHKYQQTGNIYINQQNTYWMIAESSDIPESERKNFRLYKGEYCPKCEMRCYELIDKTVIEKSND